MKRGTAIIGGLILAAAAFALKPPDVVSATKSPPVSEPDPDSRFTTGASSGTLPSGVHYLAQVDLSSVITTDGQEDERFVAVFVTLDYFRYWLALYNGLERVAADGTQEISVGGNYFADATPIDREIMGVTGLSEKVIFVLSVRPAAGLTWRMVRDPKVDLEFDVTEKTLGG